MKPLCFYLNRKRQIILTTSKGNVNITKGDAIKLIIMIEQMVSRGTYKDISIGCILLSAGFSVLCRNQRGKEKLKNRLTSMLKAIG